MKIETEQDATDVFKRLLDKMLPDVLRQTVNNIRVATVTNVKSKSRHVDVRILGTGNVLSNMRYGRGITGVQVGDKCLVVSPDPKLKNQNFVVGIY